MPYRDTDQRRAYAREYYKNYRLTHVDQYAKSRKRSYENNKEKIAAARRRPEYRAIAKRAQDKYRASHREERNARKRELRRLNSKPRKPRVRTVTPEHRALKKREAQRRYIAANRDSLNARKRIRSRAWRLANRDKKSAQTRDYYQRNRSKVLELNAKWKRSKTGWMAQQSAERKAKKLNAVHLWQEGDKEIVELIYAEARHRKMHVDHIVPLTSNIVCGLHVFWNMQLLTPQQNCAKHNSLSQAA